MPGPYRMPAEWEPHHATWLAWPHERSDWPGKFAPIHWVYAEVARHLAEVERVELLLPDEDARRNAERIFRKSGVNLAAVGFHIAPTNRSWTRDFCPLFVHDGDGAVTATDWIFNGWAKYPNHQLDNAIPKFAARKAKAAREKIPIVLEGGSIDVNGQGTMLTTTECLLSPVQARNPKLTRQDLEAAFARYLGVTKVLWLERGIAGDDTHGHVDDLARFVNPTTVVTAVEPDPLDPNHLPLEENLRLLRRMTDQDGRPLKVLTLPMPAPVWFDQQRLPASYANFYIANKTVLVPTFNDPDDRLALNTLAKAFPDRVVVPVYSRDLVLGLGTLHCMTQQQPAPR